MDSSKQLFEAAAVLGKLCLWHGENEPVRQALKDAEAKMVLRAADQLLHEISMLKAAA